MDGLYVLYVYVYLSAYKELYETLYMPGCMAWCIEMELHPEMPRMVSCTDYWRISLTCCCRLEEEGYSKLMLFKVRGQKVLPPGEQRNALAAAICYVSSGELL